VDVVGEEDERSRRKLPYGSGSDGDVVSDPSAGPPCILHPARDFEEQARFADSTSAGELDHRESVARRGHDLLQFVSATHERPRVVIRSTTVEQRVRRPSDPPRGRRRGSTPDFRPAERRG
jgi:hypothetical protein